MGNECPKCTHCQAEKAKKSRIKRLWAGAKVQRCGEVYLVAQVSAGLFHLVGLQDGNRWTDPARPIGELVHVANKDGFWLKKGAI